MEVYIMGNCNSCNFSIEKVVFEKSGLEIAVPITAKNTELVYVSEGVFSIRFFANITKDCQMKEIVTNHKVSLKIKSVVYQSGSLKYIFGKKFFKDVFVCNSAKKTRKEIKYA